MKMLRVIILAYIGCLFLHATSGQRTGAKAASTLVCEEPVYEVREGETVRVCLKFAGPLTMRSDEDDLFVEADIYTHPVTDGVLDFATANFSFKVTFDSQSRGLITLPCVEVGGVSSEGVMSVKVMIAQYSPHEALRNCTVEIIEPTEDTEAPALTEATPTRDSDIPQRQEAIGPIAGAAVGAIIGLVGIIVAVVTLLAVCCCYCRQSGSEHKKLDPSGSNEGQRPVMYKKPECDSSGSELSVGSALPPNKTDLVAIPVYKDSAVGHVSEGSSVDETPSSPIYGNVSHEEYEVPSSNVSHDGPSLPEEYEVPSSLSLPEEYEVPISLMNNRSSSIDETALAYEVPLRSKSDPLYHTLEPPEI